MRIHVDALTKVYRVPIKEPGLAGSLRSLFNRQHRDVRAVDAVSFDIAPGERVGFLGPNGAGKTTTLKMLTGLLHPTSGTCRVGDFRPRDRDPALLRQITLVMGQKQQLVWDLPPLETFALNRALFDIPRAQYREALDELVALLELGDVIERPTRNLSLGQRMRCELAAALLHRPRVLFLDEPTIGLDVQAQALVRRFIDTYNRRHDATIMLTSHDMDDVAHIAQRIILIDRGQVRFDGTLDALKARFGTGRRLTVRGHRQDWRSVARLEDLGFTPCEDGVQAIVAAELVNTRLAEILRRLPGADVTVADPSLEEVLTRAFGDEA